MPTTPPNGCAGSTGSASDRFAARIDPDERRRRSRSGRRRTSGSSRELLEAERGSRLIRVARHNRRIDDTVMRRVVRDRVRRLDWMPEQLQLEWFEQERPRSSLAEDAGSVRDPRLGGHAPTDAGRAGDSSLLRGLARVLAHVEALAAAATRAERHPRVAGARLQPPRRQPAPRRAQRRRARMARGPDRASGSRALHSRRSRALRLRRRTCSPSTRTSAACRSGPGQPSAPHAAHALMDLGATVCLARVPRCGEMPTRGCCPVARPPLRAAAAAGPLRRLVPPAPRPRLCGSSPRARENCLAGLDGERRRGARA